MRAWLNEHAMWLGWLAGWVLVGIFILVVAIDQIVLTRQVELPFYIGAIEDGLFFLFFTVFLFGIRGFAVHKADTELTKTANTLIWINVLEMLLFYPYSFSLYLEQEFLTVLLAASIPVFCINGIVLLRLAEGFNAYVPEFGGAAKRIVWSNKIAGWMLASVILILPGFVVALFGEFFLWRFLAKQSKNTKVYTSTNTVPSTSIS